MNERVRIKDIARVAGVSPGTVDRVLHNRGNVSPEAKEKVMAAMSEMGYERNLLASALAYNRLFRIAVLMPDFSTDPYWEQPFSGIRKALKAVQHYGVVGEYYIFDLFDPADFMDKAHLIFSSAPDAILFPPLFLKEGKELLRLAREQNIPNVIINTYIENADSLCYIGQDSYQSGVLAGRLLNFGLNAKETALILNLEKGITNAIHLLQKERGFRDYFDQNQQKQIEVIRQDFEDFEDDDKLSAFLNELTRQFPRLSGIFVTNSRAYRVVDNLTKEQLSKIKIVGFDLVAPNLQHLQTNAINFIINQNPVEQGYQGIMNLFNYLFLKENVENLQYLPLDIVVAENVTYYLKRQESFQLVI